MATIEENSHDLQQRVQETIPAFADSVRAAVRERMKSGKETFITQHQDAFAADYQFDDYLLLGMAIKYAGLYGVQVHIIGTNRETVDKK